MAALVLDSEQRFTCQQCGRCCRRNWEISLTRGEAASYRKAGAGRWYRESADGSEGTDADPFEPIPGHAPYERIRKRADGHCGFLSPGNRCRIHEELGSTRKPLTCQLFPFRFHPGDGSTLLTASFSCPTVVANEGALLSAQEKDVARLRRAWADAYPGGAVPRSFVPGRGVSESVLRSLRGILKEMLDRPGPGGAPDLRANVARMAHTLDDLTRYRVVRLPPDGFAEYLELTGRHAARSETPLPPHPPSLVSRLLFRGFLFAVLAARLQLGEGSRSGLRLGLRLRLARLLAHLHGLGPPVGENDLGAARRASIDLQDEPLRALVHNYLRATLSTLGAHGRTVIEEISASFSFLSASFVLARMRAGRAGRRAVETEDLVESLMDSLDLRHAESHGLLASFLATLSGGVDALHVFAWGRELGGPPQGPGVAAEV